MNEPTTAAGPPDWADAEAWVIGCFALNDGDVAALEGAFTRVRAEARAAALDEARAAFADSEPGEWCSVSEVLAAIDALREKADKPGTIKDYDYETEGLGGT